jgi:hypothetical protein
MTSRQVIVRPGRHLGWWVEGRKTNGKLFILTWWPIEAIARAVARWVGGRNDDAIPPGSE